MTKDEIEPYKYSKTNFQDKIECWGLMNLNDKSVKIAGKTYKGKIMKAKLGPMCFGIKFIDFWKITPNP